MATDGNYLQTGHMFAGSTIAPLAEALVRDSFNESQSRAEQERKAEAEARLSAYEDDYADTIRARIQATYEGPNAAELVKVLDVTNNPLKRIVNEVSTLYAKPPVWSFKDAKAGPAWRSILRRGRAGVVFPRLNRMVNLLNTAFIYVRPCGDSLAFKVALPQDVSVIPDPDNPSMPFAAMLREIDPASPGAAPVYHRWDRRPRSEFFGYRKFDAAQREIRGTALPLPYYDDPATKTGPVIPVVAYHREWPTWSFWDQTSGDDLYELTMMVGMWETWINHLFRTDSARQKYATGLVDTTVEQTGGPDTLLSIRSPDGQPVNVGEFSSQSDWDGLGQQVKRKFENVLSSRGLVLPDSRTSGDPTSGFALMVRSQGLIQARASQEPSFEVSDLELYRVVAAVWNFEITNTAHPLLVGDPLPAPNVAEPSVKYAAYHVGKTAEERAKDLEIAEKMIALGYASPESVYMDENPGVSEEEAREIIAKNKAATAVEGADEVDPQTALNGAQVTSLVEVVKSVALKQMPRETGIEIIVAAFPVDRDTANRLMGPTGATFFAEVPAKPASFGQPPIPPKQDAKEDGAEPAGE